MEMTPRERLLATVAFEPVDGPYRQETIGYWAETIERWNGEGLPLEVSLENWKYFVDLVRDTGERCCR